MTEIFNKIALEELLKKHFKYLGVDLNADGISSYQIYECNRCKNSIPIQQTREHYEMHTIYSNGDVRK